VNIINFMKDYFYVFILLVFFIIMFIIYRQITSSEDIRFISSMAKSFNFLPKKLSPNYKNVISDSINRLGIVKQELFNIDDKHKIDEDYQNVITDFFKGVFEIEGTFNYSIISSVVKNSIKNPFLAELFIYFYSYSTNITYENPLFKIELNEKIEEDIRILTKISEAA
jgi:hypothetical protein